MSTVSEEFKRAFQNWKVRVLAAVLGVPDLVDTAAIVGYGEIQLIIDGGKIKYVNVVPKFKVESQPPGT
jgi:hypothetical protein